MKKLLLPTALLLCAFFISCSESDDRIDANQSPNIASYKKTTSGTANGSSFERTMAGPLTNNKFHSFSYEEIVDGEVTDFQEIDSYQYDGNLLIQRMDEDHTSGRVTNLFYDSDGKLVGAKLSSEDGFLKYYRIVEASESTYYLEVLNQPHTDPNANIMSRYIVELDGNYNILKAGKDQNLDGLMESEKIFTYTNNNMTSIQINGVVENIAYSSIKDTRRLVLDKSHSKKVARIICAEAVVVFNVNRIKELNLSENLTIDQANAATYEVADNGFYTKKETVESYLGDTTTETTEFFFE